MLCGCVARWALYVALLCFALRSLLRHSEPLAVYRSDRCRVSRVLGVWCIHANHRPINPPLVPLGLRVAALKVVSFPAGRVLQ
jgi:hypothetical protein